MDPDKLIENIVYDTSTISNNDIIDDLITAIACNSVDLLDHVNDELIPSDYDILITPADYCKSLLPLFELAAARSPTIENRVNMAKCKIKLGYYSNNDTGLEHICSGISDLEEAVKISNGEDVYALYILGTTQMILAEKVEPSEKINLYNSAIGNLRLTIKVSDTMGYDNTDAKYSLAYSLYSLALDTGENQASLLDEAYTVVNKILKTSQELGAIHLAGDINMALAESAYDESFRDRFVVDALNHYENHYSLAKDPDTKKLIEEIKARFNDY